MEQPSTVCLRGDLATAELAPSQGARLMRWNVNGRPVLHWPESPDWTRSGSIRGGNPLLFPFIARTFLDGQIGFWKSPDGQKRPAPMHGLVRAAPFAVTEHRATRMVMRIESDQEMLTAYPFPFRFTVSYELIGAELHVEYLVENLGATDMPYSVGNHFYFDIPAAERSQWSMVGQFTRSGRQAADGTIVDLPALTETVNLSDPSLVDLFHIGPPRDGVRLSHQTDGRSVQIDWPPQMEEIWYAVTTWTEKPDSDFYCVEPWTALPDAVHNGQGLRWLKPGASEALHLRLSAQGW
jgi:galactose mutarotase-like enzyme